MGVSGVHVPAWSRKASPYVVVNMYTDFLEQQLADAKEALDEARKAAPTESGESGPQQVFPPAQPAT